jgi:hypothetical protein
MAGFVNFCNITEQNIERLPFPYVLTYKAALLGFGPGAGVTKLVNVTTSAGTRLSAPLGGCRTSVQKLIHALWATPPN